MNKITMNNKKLQWRQYIVLGLIITLSLVQIIVYFSFFKQGYHSDEMWSYGYANSFYQRNIYIDDDGNYTYMNEWTDSGILKDFVVVNKGERFRYDSIYHNQIVDLSPPLHSMVLHTICSFFPEKFSKWYSFSINIVAFIVCMIYLYKAATLLKNEKYALCCCALYGFSMGARDTYIYLRMYAMGTAMTMIIIYNIIKYLQQYQKEKKIFNINLVAIWIVSLLSFLTHYHLVSFMGIVTALICVYMLCKKQIKAMFAIGFSMLAVFGMSVAIFPAMLGIANGNVTDVKKYLSYTFEIRFRVLSNFVLMKLFSIHIDPVESGMGRVVIGCFVFMLIVAMPLMIYMRKSVFMQKLVSGIVKCVKHPVETAKFCIRKTNKIYAIILLAIAFQMIVVGETTKLYGMGAMEDRYLFNLYPLAVLVGTGMVYSLLYVILKKKDTVKKIYLGLIILLVGINIYNCTQYGDYLFVRVGTPDVEDVIENTDCIYVRNSPWILTVMVPTLMNTKEFAQIQYTEYTQLEHLYNERKNQGPVMVVLDTSFTSSYVENMSTSYLNGEFENNDKMDAKRELYDDIIEFLENLEPDTKMEEKTEQYIFGRKMEVYLINP